VFSWDDPTDVDYYINQLTQIGDTILDSSLSNEKVVLSSLHLGRQCIGISDKKSRLKQVNKRLEEEISKKQHYFQNLKPKVNKLNEKIFNELTYLKSLSVRELNETRNKDLVDSFYERHSEFEFEEFKDKHIFSQNDVNDLMENDPEIQIELVKTPEQSFEFSVISTFVGSLPVYENVGRQLKYVIKLNGKIGGIICLASDLIGLSNRDRYIGWTKREDWSTGKINNLCVTKLIIPTQPLGYFVGGKLLTLLLYSKQFRDDWYETYGDVLVGMTITSLFGSYSQYTGLGNKLRKIKGGTKGKVLLYPKDNTCKEIYSLLRELSEFDPGIKEQLEDIENNLPSSPKQKTINLYYKYSGFKDLWETRSGETLHHGFKRGLFFMELYKNTKEFLRGEIKEDGLKGRDLDFHENGQDIFKYWKEKYFERRYLKLVDCKN
jgi:hypothetical protein